MVRRHVRKNRRKGRFSSRDSLCFALVNETTERHFGNPNAFFTNTILFLPLRLLFSFSSHNLLNYNRFFFFQSLFSIEGTENGRKLYPQQVNGVESRDKPHTLLEYAIDHFR